MSKVPTLAGQPVTLDKCWTFILERPEVLEKFVYFFLKESLLSQLQQPPTSEEIEDYLNQFSQVSRLSSAEQFEHWLEAHNDSYDSFMERVRHTIAVKKFCSKISEYQDIKSKFDIKTYLFDYFLLSRMTFTDQASAHAVHNQIKKGDKIFEQIFQFYSSSKEVNSAIWKEALIRAELPNQLQTLLLSQDGNQTSYLTNYLVDELVKIGQGWSLIYIHQFSRTCS